VTDAQRIAMTSLALSGMWAAAFLLMKLVIALELLGRMLPVDY
jgi:hypothetical protein